MKHMAIRKTLCAVLSCVVLTLCSSGVSSEEDVVSGTLDFYMHKIELLNEKYGTDLNLATFSMTESEISDLMLYYSEMTDEEFEEYFYDIVKIAKAYPAPISESYLLHDELDANNLPRQSKNAKSIDDTYPVEQTQPINSAVVYSPSVSETQHYYYNNSNENNLNIISTVNYSSGWGQYVTVDFYSSHVDEYPAYKLVPKEIIPFSYKINSYYNESTADCSFPCYWYITGQFTQGGVSYQNVTFTAGKGDIFTSEWI